MLHPKNINISLSLCGFSYQYHINQTLSTPLTFYHTRIHAHLENQIVDGHALLRLLQMSSQLMQHRMPILLYPVFAVVINNNCTARVRSPYNHDR